MFKIVLKLSHKWVEASSMKHAKREYAEELLKIWRSHGFTAEIARV